jgi:V/A-type H+/Na+-transporting ATPase subunit I
MLAPVPMVRVRIQVPQREGAAATHAIARLGLLHLIDIAHGRSDVMPSGTEQQLAEHLALRNRIRRIADRLEVGAPPIAGRIDEPLVTDFGFELRALEAACEPVEASVERAWERRSVAVARAAVASRTLEHARRLDRAGLDVRRLLSARFVALRLVSGSQQALEALTALLMPMSCALIPVEAGAGGTLAVVAVPASAADRLDSALRLVQLETIGPDALVQSASVEAAEAALRGARGEEEAAGDALARLRIDQSKAVMELLAHAEACVLLVQANIRFGATGRFVVISGWIPEHAVGAIRAAVAAVSPAAVVDAEQARDMPETARAALRIPIFHRNPLLLRPFQPLIELYGTPQYQEVQPTAFFAVSFLLMFGLMFGDVGHGATLAFAGYCLFRFVPHFLDYGILLAEAGTASMLFGVLYGSVFGVEGLLPVVWLSPLHDLPSFMRIAVAFGVVLVSIGLALNVVNSWRAGERAAALFGLRGLFGAFLYWTSLALVARAVMPRALTVPAWLLWTLVLSAAALVAMRAPVVAHLEPARRTRTADSTPRWLGALEGSVELVDTLFSYFANTISFVRIAAFAAVHAGVFIAMFAVSDTLADMTFGRPLSIAALIAGNIVLVLLEGLTVSVQVLRLEYYEFFGKFFRGGGELYRPLMLRSNGKGGVP